LTDSTVGAGPAPFAVGLLRELQALNPAFPGTWPARLA